MKITGFAGLYGSMVPNRNLSERMRRCPIKQLPRAKNGAHFRDGRPGWSNWAKTHWYNSPEAKGGFTNADTKAWGESKHARKRRQAEVHRQAKRRAAALLRACKPVKHPNLRSTLPPDARGLDKSWRASVISASMASILVGPITVTCVAPAQKMQWKPR